VTTRTKTFEPEFVGYMPAEIAPSRLYISLEYRITKHRCACGCGDVVVLPIHPAQWHLAFDGEHVTLAPSIGNPQQRCRSHYFIRNNRVLWAAPLAERDATDGRRRCREAVADLDTRAATRLERPKRVVALLRRQKPIRRR
jgi:hypothetical protein